VEYASFNGIHGEATKVTLDNVTLDHNLGKALTHQSQELNLIDVNIFSNMAGILAYNSTLNFDRCKVHQNSDIGLNLQNGCTGHISNLLVNDNGGDGIYLKNNPAPPILFNLTLGYNIGKDLVCDVSAPIYNSILWNHHATYAGPCSFSYCDVRGGATGTGNIDADPLFENNYSLQSGSPCINKGLNTVPGGYTMPALDLAKNPRIDSRKLEKKIDMGAFEY